MDINDKTLVINFLQLPRLGLNQRQIGAIERIIDGRNCADDGDEKRPFLKWQEVGAIFGLKSRQGVWGWVKNGTLDAYTPPGRTIPIGITRESVNRVLARRKAVA